MRAWRVGTATLAVLLLAGCTGAREPEALVTAAATPAEDAPLARFTAVAESVVRADRDAGGRAFTRALERAGWERRELQVTADRTSVGLAVPSVQFSARDGGSCLIGQYGGGALRTQRAAPVNGACLIGGTRDPG